MRKDKCAFKIKSFEFTVGDRRSDSTGAEAAIHGAPERRDESRLLHNDDGFGVTSAISAQMCGVLRV
jgi:hypothetical protein